LRAEDGWSVIFQRGQGGRVGVGGGVGVGGRLNLSDVTVGHSVLEERLIGGESINPLIH
jgi:hypothetical protein